MATDKDDPDTFQDKIESKKLVTKISYDQTKALYDLAEEYAELRGMHGEDATNQALKWAANQLKISSIDDANEAQADSAIKAFRDMISKHREQRNAAAEKQNTQQESLLEGRTTQPVNWGSK